MADPTTKTCPVCRGKPTYDGTPCPLCGGKLTVTVQDCRPQPNKAEQLFGQGPAFDKFVRKLHELQAERNPVVIAEPDEIEPEDDMPSTIERDTDKIVALTADHVRIEPGMELWANSGYSGEPPTKVTVGKVVSPHKFLYPETDEQGYEGARAASCWFSGRKAMLHALMAGEPDPRFQDGR